MSMSPGPKVWEVCREHGMSDAVLCKGNGKHGGVQVSGLRGLKCLEAESAEQKRLMVSAMRG